MSATPVLADTTPDRTTIMQALRDDGVSDAAIARAFNLTRQRIGAILGPRLEPRKPVPGPLDTTADKRLPSALRDWRHRRGMTQRDAGAMLGVDLQTVSVWESGRKGCSLATMLLRYLDLTDEIDKIASVRKEATKTRST